MEEEAERSGKGRNENDVNISDELTSENGQAFPRMKSISVLLIMCCHPGGNVTCISDVGKEIRDKSSVL